MPLRNRYHYPPEVPQALLGPQRDAALYRADHPAARARRGADTLRAAALPVLIDAAGADALNAHDGAEHLHRVLWDLDIAHEYHLRLNSDHAGPDLVDRLQHALRWVRAKLQPDACSTEPSALRAQLEPLRRAALARDPTVARRYGVLLP